MDSSSGNDVDLMMDHCDMLADKFTLLGERLKLIENKLTDQGIVLDQHLKYLQRLRLKKVQVRSNLNIFPITSVPHFQRVEAEIDTYDRDDLYAHIKLTVGKTRLKKCGTKFFTEEAVMNFNWDGRAGKIPIASSTLFATHVFGAVKSKDMDYQEFAVAMRDSFRLYKNQIYRKVSVGRQ